ncbi:Por secretion system C-terminal sorting domain-containing protein [Catalinimonas alkaloidigena]|uniref:Por secretion system C-terminal sorting domain-containing protein n=1 Tax=Catalinimonas alkaloidigena TaxID=1075417 RepID=A0A1G9E9C2_9BACT|nr:LamG-like jellyroll fold domain-containing protein [Catalinimonas alkaloidigena]SDK72721.1 Por secretion system C-terminal sorting domain-containing protein [Catalinimonas alkaloidigena]
MKKLFFFCLAALVSGMAFAQMPVAIYPLDGDAMDVSGNGFDGTVAGATPTINRFGTENSAYLFDGDMDSIVVSNASNALAMMNSEYTSISFWIKVNSFVTADENYIISFGGWQERLKISLPAHRRIVWSTRTSTGNADMDATDPYVLDSTDFHHVVMVHGIDTNFIYMDGERAHFITTENNPNVAGGLLVTSADFVIGSDAMEGERYFKGVLDDIMVYNYAISAAMVDSIYTAQSDGPLTSIQTDRFATYLTTVFPNPVRDVVMLRPNFDGVKQARLDVYDMLGRQMQSVDLTSQMRSDLIRLDVSTLRAGQYLMKLSVDGEPMGAYKLLKQ